MELDALQVLPESSERVEVALPRLAPIHELDSELEGGLGGGDELILVEPEHRVECHQRRDCRFADSDRADLVGFNQDRLRISVVEVAGQSGSSHPSGGAAAHNDDLANRMFVHLVPWIERLRR